MSNKVTLRRLNKIGLAHFESILSKIRAGEIINIPGNLIYDDEYSEKIIPFIEFQPVDYLEKYRLITHIVEELNLTNNKQYYYDTGLWSWLSALYFNNICPSDNTGKRKIKEDAQYILREARDFQKYYRHLLAYPCRLLAEIGSPAFLILTGNFNKRGEMTEQIGARQELALNKGFFEAANILYWDNNNLSIKRGASGKGAGSVRRLCTIFGQYSLTYDLGSMSGEKIAQILPEEFDKWKGPKEG